MKCERCGTSSGDDPFDYCNNCAANLCPKCMAKGCCGKVPAASGMQADFGEQEPAEPPEVDDSVKCCPNCERPNQFGETCQACREECDAPRNSAGQRLAPVRQWMGGHDDPRHDL